MERLSHDLNLALEESAGTGAGGSSGGCGCGGGGERRKLGLRRRTRSAGNLPAACSGPLEEGSSSSPGRGARGSVGAPGPPQQHLSDSDEGKPARVPLYCPPGRSVESDSFNENLSPTRPPNTRRKRKYKKMAVDCAAPVETDVIHPLVTQTHSLCPVAFSQSSGLSPVSQITKKKRIIKSERVNAYCGKRKWSVRERNDIGEMRERSFSGGCTSKSYFFAKNYDFKGGKKFALDKMQAKPKLITPGNLDLTPPRNPVAPSLPGSSSFNFVYKNPQGKSGAPCFRKITGFKITTELPPVFDPIIPSPVSHKHRKSKQERGGGDGEMDCVNEAVSESSWSSSDSEGVVTCDSDREGDDELTDWPGSDEISVFNRTLNFKTGKGITPQVKSIKKEKYLPKYGPNGCKNRPNRIKPDVVPDDEAMMSDSGTLGADDSKGIPFTSFGEVKDAGLLARGTNAEFFQSFQTNSPDAMFDFGDKPRSNFSLQKTSSSDLNMSEKSPQSDHCCGESCEVREIRAGCRRIRDERPGLVILSANNERLSRFLQDSCSAELRLSGCGDADPAEREKLKSLAKLYSLELHLELDKAVLRKTSNTMQATRVEFPRAQRSHAFSEYKRRCYGGEEAGGFSPPSPPSPVPLVAPPRLLDSILDPGDID